MPTIEQIDAILPFLAEFESPQLSAGEWVHNPGTFGYVDYSEVVRRFRAALDRHGWIVSFDWPGWSQEARSYTDSPEKLAMADLDTIQKLFTTHIRAERFCEGHLASVVKSGHITALLRRLAEIRQEMG